MFKLVKNKDGDCVIKYREDGKVVYIKAEDIDLTPWDLIFLWNGNRQWVLDKCNEYLILKDLKE